MPTEFETGFLVGLLVGEGHFGGDGRQPHVTLRMHERHEAMFRWIDRTFPGGKLYGPYDHGGRRYYQWMARGPYLRDYLFPLLDKHLTSRVDGYARRRLDEMHARYERQLRMGGSPQDQGSGAPIDAAGHSPPFSSDAKRIAQALSKLQRPGGSPETDGPSTPTSA
jgi:hypothetical protein